MTAPAYLHLPPDAAPPPSPIPAPFKAVLVLEAPTTPAWRDRIAAWLVERGCLYAMAWGTDCEAWHDAIDEAFIAAHPDGLPGDDQLIMTTWHDDEPLEELARFAAHDATHPSGELAAPLVLHIAQAPREAELLAAMRAP